MRVRIPRLGRLVKQLRLERDIDQKEVSAAVRYSTRSLRRLEKEGERPERTMLIRILTKGLGIHDLQVINDVLVIARYLELTADEASHYGISVSGVIAIAVPSTPPPEPQETRWGPTDDKPGVTLETPRNPERVSSFLNIRVADIQSLYEQWNARGAEFLTPPVNNGREIRAYIRDPDGHLIEVGQTTGPLEQRTAKHDPTRRRP